MATELTRDPGFPIHRGRYLPRKLRPQVGPEGREARRLALQPLFRWICDHGGSQTRVPRLAYRRHTGMGCTANHAYQVRHGMSPAPDWLVDECCAVLGVSRETIWREYAEEQARETAGNSGQDAERAGARTASGWDVA
ncbi:MAG TPA: hypothetical protein VF808_00740 [Ktedonobacterales bacterium]